MLRLVESIKVENGMTHNLEYHQERMDRSVQAITGKRNVLQLRDELIVPDEYSSGLYKCRFVYTDKAELIEFIPYKKRNICTLKIVHADIEYSCKYEERGAIDKLLLLHGECDDILIVKNGLVTDTSFSNIAFTDGKAWFTPAKPLLKGTKRSRLLREGFLAERDIAVEDLHKFRYAAMINAMLDPGEIVIPVESIHAI